MRQAGVTKISYLVNNKLKKWTLFAIFFTVVLAFGDYSVFTLSIPEFNQLNVNEGIVRVELGKGGGRFGGTSGDQLTLTKDRKVIKFNCWINERRNKSCIPRSDSRFYESKQGDESWHGTTKYYNPKNLNREKYGYVWWYRASIFGPIKENRLLQLEVENEIIVSYEQQKRKYLMQKSHHDYTPTILLVFLIIWFFVLQVANNFITINGEE